MTRHSGKYKEMGASRVSLDESSLKLFELGLSHSDVHLNGFNVFRQKEKLERDRTLQVRGRTHSIIGGQNHDI